MSIKRVILVFIPVLLATIDLNAGCLEPQKDMGTGSFVVESCSFHTTTKMRYEDPRLSNQKIKNPTDLLAIDQKKGPGKILSLSKGNVGVLVTGKFMNQNAVAFIRTEDPKYCGRFTKSNTIAAKMVENCCDCFNACEESPCALDTKNELLLK